MSRNKNHSSINGRRTISLIAVVGLAAFSLNNICFSLNGLENSVELYKYQDNVISLDTDVDDNLSTTSESVTREDSEVVRQHIVSDAENLQQNAAPPINSTRIIDGNATDNAAHNRYTQLLGSYNHKYKESRNASFLSWFEGNTTDKLKHNADSEGPILDFVITGFAKCGTTTVDANLGYLAPMLGGDICTPISQIVYYAYKQWPDLYGNHKIFRGSKCPQYIGTTDYMTEISNYLPRTTIIIGIRHPVLWFQSFWNMQASVGNTKYVNNDPYMVSLPCVSGKPCSMMCPRKRRMLFCLHRGRFHVALAALGKTALSEEERKILAPNDIDGGKNLISNNIRNPIFLYEQMELSEDYVWDELAKQLNVATIPHDKYVSSHGKKRNNNLSIDFCEERMDDFRAMMMPYAYELSIWLQDYFIPVGKDESSNVIIPNPEKLSALVEKYKKDPCGRLYRLTNGTYVLHTNITTIIEVARR